MRGLQPEFHGALSVRTVPHTSSEAKRVVAREGWASHGAIATYRGRRVYQAADHRVNVLEIYASLREALGQPLECR
ncbi:MAG: hypothetical protein JNG84_02910 [Archangium sp.]|nr:hypothetical protein [Archangium sp.]